MRDRGAAEALLIGEAGVSDRRAISYAETVTGMKVLKHDGSPHGIGIRGGPDEIVLNGVEVMKR